MLTLLKWCPDCDDDTPHRQVAYGPLDCDLHTYCVVCKVREMADDHAAGCEDED